MPTLHIEAQVSDQQLLRAVHELSPEEFQRFVAEVLALRARRQAPRLTATEAELLQRINQGLALDLAERYDQLVARRRDESLTPDEHEELIRLSDAVEEHDARRAAALTELAQVRNVPLGALMEQLGIKAPAHD
jgi:hypothetical protein